MDVNRSSQGLPDASRHKRMPINSSLTRHDAIVIRTTLSVFFFFFSSRRRHTRYWRDWSSDVCSSDLVPLRRPRLERAARAGEPPARQGQDLHGGIRRRALGRARARGEGGAAFRRRAQIGRAAGREKGEISGGAVSFKKKKKK